MGCILSLCNINDKEKDKDYEEEKGQFDALIMSGNLSNPNPIGRENSDDVIPLFAPAPSDDDIIISSDSENIEEEESDHSQTLNETEN